MKKMTVLFLLVSICITAQIKKADSLLQLGNYQAALLVLNTTKNSFETVNKKGIIYQQIGNYQKAITYYTKALDFKKNLKTKENLGKCYQRINQTLKAISLFEEVLLSNPKNTLLKYHLAKLYKSKLKFKKAKNIFKNIILTDNTNPNYYYYLGSTYLNLKQKDSAKIHFLNAIKKDSTHFKSLYNLTKQYRKIDKYKKYRKVLKEKFKPVNNDTSYYYLERGLKYYPKNKALNELAAKYTFSDEKYHKTISHLNNLDYLSAKNQQKIAMAYYYIQDYEKSKDYLYDLIESKKATTQAYFYLALTYKAEKNFELAQQYMEFAILIEQPQLTEFYFQLGLIFQENKQLSKAIKNFKLALEEKKLNSKAQYQLALTCDSYYKDKTIALKHYENYLSKFKFKNPQTVAFVEQRIKELNVMIFTKK